MAGQKKFPPPKKKIIVSPLVSPYLSSSTIDFYPKSGESQNQDRNPPRQNQSKIRLLNFRGTEDVISSNLPYIEWHVRLTVFFEHLFHNKCIALNNQRNQKTTIQYTEQEWGLSIKLVFIQGRLG